MKNVFLFIVLYTNLCFSQSKQVTIIGNIPQQLGGEYVSFSKPIGKYTTLPNYINSKDTAALKNNKFIKKLVVSASGLIYVYEKPFNGTISTRFFAEPGDTIVIERQNGEIIFKGKNAIVNKMFSDIRLGPVAFNDFVNEIFKNNNTAEKIIEKINEKEEKNHSLYNDLFLKGQISKSCLEYAKVVSEHSIDGLALGLSKNEDFRKEQKMLITKEEADKIVSYFNLKYILFNQENLKSLFFFGLIKSQAVYLENQSLKENKKINRFWNKFDEVFAKKRINFGVIDYLESEDYKETYIGEALLDLIIKGNKDKAVNLQELVMVYKAFVEKFPNSAYIIPLSESIMDKTISNLGDSKIINAPKIGSKITLGSLTIYGTKLEPVDTTPFAQPNQPLIEALTEKFPNQDVFIDLWATWCGPCLMQFPYNKDLHSFLDTKNIKTLYVSFDKEEETAKWEKYIQDYNLTGYHFLANKAYQEKFLNPLSATIPRYFVYNSKTKELKPLEGLPKEKETFYANISKALLTI